MRMKKEEENKITNIGDDWDLHNIRNVVLFDDKGKQINIKNITYEMDSNLQIDYYDPITGYSIVHGTPETTLTCDLDNGDKIIITKKGKHVEKIRKYHRNA